ncbi:MAG: hypothetical protein LBD20_00045 [Spirochaetaceae bacterium]|nr:hypothetical protein [Spirochaetaceae bacterium]
MKKKALIFTMPVILALCVNSGLFGQQKQGELSIEESFLQEPIEIQIIREQGASSGREPKMLALEFIEEYMSGGGTTSTALNDILQDLSLQGTLNKERVAGGNDFADVRWTAAEKLGDVSGEQAVHILRRLVLNETEPAVAVSAIQSLTKLQAYDETTEQCVNICFRKFDTLRPDDRLALTVLDYYAAAPSPKPRYMGETINAVRVSAKYQKPVRDRAASLLKTLFGRKSNKQ